MYISMSNRVSDGRFEVHYESEDHKDRIHLHHNGNHGPYIALSVEEADKLRNALSEALAKAGR